MTVETAFQNIANAIRTRAGTSGVLTPAQLPQAILDIPGGGSGGVLVGESAPDASEGNDGDFYIQYGLTGTPTAEVPAQSDYTNVIYSNDWPGDNGQAWHLFDGNTSRYWSTTLQSTSNQWCGYDFGAGNEKIIKRVGIYPRRYGSNTQIHDFKIQASNDNNTWIDLYSGSIPNTADAVQWNYFDFSNATAYRYYRLFVINANSSQTITVFEAQFYSIPSGDILTVYAIYHKVNGVWVLQS